jgi:hypothetical protein
LTLVLVDDTKKRRGFPATANHSLHRFYNRRFAQILRPYIGEGMSWSSRKLMRLIRRYRLVGRISLAKTNRQDAKGAEEEGRGIRLRGRCRGFTGFGSNG